MGQKQLLVVILGIIIVGIAIVMGIQYFRQHAIDSKRDLVINECANLGNMALKHYMRPFAYGGGGSTTFIGFRVPRNLRLTASGTYRSVAFKDSVIIFGTGNDVVNGSDSIRVKMIVVWNSLRTEIIN